MALVDQIQIYKSFQEDKDCNCLSLTLASSIHQALARITILHCIKVLHFFSKIQEDMELDCLKLMDNKNHLDKIVILLSLDDLDSILNLP